MPLITLFSAPKSFTNPHIAMIQRNAIKSWTLLPDVEVILLGEETGLAEAAREIGVKHIPNVERNASGTPLISSMFQLVRKKSNSDLLCIINADMILMADFMEAARRSRLQRDKFVLLSQRWDLDVTQPIEFTEGWQDRLRSTVHAQGTLHRPAGSDFFLFPKSCYIDLPNFTIGRAGWDNWMIYHARKQGWPVVDATPSVMIVHQNHDYSHLPGGQPHYNLAESRHNEFLAGGPAHRYMVLDADRQLAGGQLRPPRRSLVRSLRQAEVWLTPPDGQRRGLRWSFARRLRRMRRRITGSL